MHGVGAVSLLDGTAEMLHAPAFSNCSRDPGKLKPCINSGMVAKQVHGLLRAATLEMMLSGTEKNPPSHQKVRKLGTSKEGSTSLVLSSSRKHTGCKTRKPGGKPLHLWALGGKQPVCCMTCSRINFSVLLLQQQEHLLQILAPAPFL